MKYLLLLLLLPFSLTSAATLTVGLFVRETFAPSRHASIGVSDGTNLYYTDLYRTFTDQGPVFLGEVTQLGYCRSVGFPSPPCTFTPGGELSVTNASLTGVEALSGLFLDGVPVSNYRDYAITFAMNFTGGSPITVETNTPWGPQTSNADLEIAITQRSTGICVFCARAPYGKGTASGEAFPSLNFPDYRFQYQASGEIVPEPSSWQLGLLGIAALFAIWTARHMLLGAIAVETINNEGRARSSWSKLSRAGKWLLRNRPRDFNERKQMKMFLYGAILFLSPVRIILAAPCTPGTLQTYVDLGSTGCELGESRFADFILGPVPPFPSIDPMLVNVTPAGTTFLPELLFTLNHTANTGKQFGLLFHFVVTGVLSGASIELISPTTSGDGHVWAFFDVCPDDFFDTAPFGCPNPLDYLSVHVGQGNAQLYDSVTSPIPSSPCLNQAFFADRQVGGILERDRSEGATQAG